MADNLRVRTDQVRSFKKSSGWVFAIGAALAAAAVVQYCAQQAEQENPPLGKFIEVDGVRLHYIERGNGPPLVLFHGNASMMQDFGLSGLLDLASRHYRVIVFDRPGYGYSERPRDRIWSPTEQARLFHRALQKLNVERPIVLGHSWGTLVALALALEYPADVRGLVLLSGYYYPTPRLDVPLVSGPAIPGLGDLMRFTISPLIGRLMWPVMRKRIFAPAEPPVRFSAFPLWMTLRPSQLRASAAESALMIPAAMALRRRYHELEMPLVIMAGADDRYVKADTHSVRLHRELPRSELHLVPGAGHMVHHAVPEQVMQAIDSAEKASLRGSNRAAGDVSVPYQQGLPH
jgi:pimeloyl-ACP methyl ester carboxylesterase